MKLIFIKQDPDAENESIDQALVFVPDNYQEDDLLEDARITDVIDEPIISAVIKLDVSALNAEMDEIGTDRPYFG